MAGGKIQLGRGQFNIAAPVTMISLVSLLGMNKGATTLYLADGADCNVLTTAASGGPQYGITVGDLKIDGNKANTTSGNGISIYHTHYSVLKHLWITGMSDKGIAYLIGDSNGQNAHVEDVEITLCEQDGFYVDTAACTDSTVIDARVYRCGMVSGYNVYISSSAWDIYRLNASYTPVGGYNVRVDASEYGTRFFAPTVGNNDAAAVGIQLFPSDASQYRSQIKGGVIYNTAVAAHTGSAILLKYGGTKVLDHTIIEGVQIEDHEYGVQLVGANVRYTSIVNNTFVDQVTLPVYDNGSLDLTCRGNRGYIHTGEIRSKGGSLTQGAANTVAFYWANPEKQDILVRKVTTDVTTASTDTGACIDIGIADSSSGTNLGTEFFDDLPTDATGINCANAMQLCQDSTSATDAYVVGLYVTDDSTALVGSYSIEYQGR